jgi:signal transduction histidine kinase/ActR/RegA family two-component response regulator
LILQKQKNYEDKINERQQVILETQKMAKIGSWEFFLDQRHLIWTEEMFRIFEIDPNTKNLLSEYFKKLHPEDKSSVSNMLTNPSFNDEINYLEYKILLDDNRVKYVSATIKPVKNDKGHVYKFWGTTQDITDIKNKEFELIKAKNESEKANRAKSDFLSNMSHELRTPINAVIGVSNLLLQESPKPEQINNLNILKFSSQNLLILINDILDFSKIEAGKIEFEETSFSLKNLVDNIKSVFSNITSEKNILIDLHFDKSIPEYIIGDSARLAQIINNLMSNAVKFTQKGSIKINISLKEKKDNLFFINFSIEDTGIGIPENKINYIFENFTQASSETNRKFGGTGLGLAITKKLIELQNGEIFVESKLHEGSKFSFILGFKESINISKNINTNIFETKSLKGLKILLVDDNKINTIIAIQFLKKWDIDVDTAINGVLAVDKIINNHYDVVLMDLQMPEMDGYEATKKIREINEDYFKNLPIIALTASATIEIREKCKKVGINDFITKPFNPDELHKKLSEYITNRVNN